MADAIKHDYWNLRNTVSYERLHELFSYDPETGEIRNRVFRGATARAGELAGNLGKRGYIRIRIDGKYFYAHRMAWCLMTGSWPEFFVDHIDEDKTNNRWVNLRKATKSQNGANRGLSAHNTSGFKGVVWDDARGKWKAQIGSKDKPGSAHIGRFDTPEEAHAAYCRVATEIHGEFARFE